MLNNESCNVFELAVVYGLDVFEVFPLQTVTGAFVLVLEG